MPPTTMQMESEVSKQDSYFGLNIHTAPFQVTNKDSLMKCFWDPWH